MFIYIPFHLVSIVTFQKTKLSMAEPALLYLLVLAVYLVVCSTEQMKSILYSVVCSVRESWNYTERIAKCLVLLIPGTIKNGIVSRSP